MNVKFVSVEDGITALGFRKVASIARKLDPKTKIYFIITGNFYSLQTFLFPAAKGEFSTSDYQRIAKELSDADLLCFSSMSPAAPYIEGIIKEIHKINKHVYILWGGAHAIICPDEAIKFADAICTGEGEIPYQKFFKAFINKENFFKTPGMWFKKGKRVYRNINLPLNNPNQMEHFPYLYNGLDCYVYRSKYQAFRDFTKYHYLKYCGLIYRTIWTIGCPFACSYCANDAFVKYDPKYRIIRHTSIDYVINEIKIAIKMYPFISTVVFYDDNFITNSLADIKAFAKKYKGEIDLPFAVPGMHPNYITREIIDTLGRAGMNRTRMGIQSGSQKILNFFHRPTPIKIVKRSANILIEKAKKYNMIPPAFDIITDNPIEKREDLIDTIKLLYNLKRPYTLNVFSLRVFPKTKLWDYFQSNQTYDIRQLTSSYLDTRQTMSTVLLYLLPVVKPPKFIFNYLLSKVEDHSPDNILYPILYRIVRTLYLTKRGVEHLIHLDFSTIAGLSGYYLWKLGVMKKPKPAVNI